MSNSHTWRSSREDAHLSKGQLIAWPLPIYSKHISCSQMHDVKHRWPADGFEKFCASSLCVALLGLEFIKHKEHFCRQRLISSIQIYRAKTRRRKENSEKYIQQWILKLRDWSSTQRFLSTCKIWGYLNNKRLTVLPNGHK